MGMGANVAEKYGGMQEKVWVPLPGGVFCRNFYMGSCINLQGVGGGQKPNGGVE